MIITLSFPIYVVSLARAVERRANITARLDSASVNYEIFNAVDGEKLDLHSLRDRLRDYDLGRLIHGRMMSRGEIGCYLSHYTLWEKIVAEETPFAVVLEDDTVWDDDFFTIAEKLPTSEWYWNVVLMGFKESKPKRASCPLSATRSLAHYRRPAWTTTAYMIDLDGAKKLLNQCYVIARPVDMEWKQYWKSDLKFYHVDPPIARTSGAKSTIDEFVERDDLSATVTFMERMKYKIYCRYEVRRRQLYNLIHSPKKRHFR